LANWQKVFQFQFQSFFGNLTFVFATFYLHSVTWYCFNIFCDVERQSHRIRQKKQKTNPIFYQVTISVSAL
jgi:hypothetical protein